jgi:hypothetical protein
MVPHLRFRHAHRSTRVLAASLWLLTQGQSYDLTFSARATTSWHLGVNLQKGADDWRNYGLARTVQVGTTWSTFTVSFEV